MQGNVSLKIFKHGGHLCVVQKLIFMIKLSDIRGTFRDCYKNRACIYYGMNCAMKFKIVCFMNNKRSSFQPIFSEITVKSFLNIIKD